MLSRLNAIQQEEQPMPEAATGTSVLTGTYKVDPAHTHIGFVARHAMVAKVRGAFREFEGSGTYDADDPSRSTLNLTIKAASIDTANADRDNHLRSSDFLDVENHPEITFASTRVEPVGDGRFKVTGDLTIRGVTRPVTIDFELSGPVQDPYGNTRIGLEGRTEINRKDWGVNFNLVLDAGGVMVGDKVILEFDVEAVKAD
jgi:polyisoprenoid-binding protein YceI